MHCILDFVSFSIIFIYLRKFDTIKMKRVESDKKNASSKNKDMYR